MSEEEQRLDAKDEATKDLKKELEFEELADILSSTIKEDKINKVITFLIMLGTYTEEEQSNEMFRAESTTGKSYIPLEIALYFPNEDVEKVGFASPTSFFHEFGIRFKREKLIRDENGEKKTEEHTYILIDMSKRIYIFKDMPSTELLVKLRSLLSHDEKELQIQFTNKNEKSGYRTNHIIIRGYPTVMFCTATGNVLDMQESTRFFILSPQTETGKIAEAIKLLAMKRGNKQKYQSFLDTNTKRIWLTNRIYAIRAEGIADIIIPDEGKVALDFISSKKHLQPRHMRDFGRLLSLIKYWALLNNWTRQKEETENGRIVYANQIDVDIGFILYNTICDANEFGLSPEVYSFYKDIFEVFDKGGGITKEMIRSAFLNTYFRPLGNKRLDKEIIPNLEAAGLIYEVEGTGVGGKAKVYRCSKYMASAEGKTTEINGQVTLEKHVTPPKNLQERMKRIVDLFAIGGPLKIADITKQLDGIIPSIELPKILEQLMKEGTLYQPDSDTYARV